MQKLTVHFGEDPDEKGIYHRIVKVVHMRSLEELED